MRNATRVSAGGRIVIPIEYRKALGIQPGDELVLDLDDNGELHLCTVEQARKRAQDWVCSLVPRDVTLVEELIRERREEAARE